MTEQGYWQEGVRCYSQEDPEKNHRSRGDQQRQGGSEQMRRGHRGRVDDDGEMRASVYGPETGSFGSIY